VHLVSNEKNGLFYTWLSLTGCYPDKFEFQEFVAEESVYGLPQAVQNVLENRSKAFETANYVVSIQLINPEFDHIVDVTHTSSNPFLTGIQRVVFGITDGAEKISTCVWVGEAGIIREQGIRKMEVTQEISRDLSWRIRLVHLLHAQVPKLEKSRFGTRLRNILLPFARKIKYLLIAKDNSVQMMTDSDKKLSNLLILNTLITIPEITATLRHVYLYEAILENEIVPVQIILYDFIPFFHAWTVHQENRAQLSSYIRLVLLASRIISISSLVHEQAKLITQAFRLERPEWSARSQEYSFLALPSGLKPANSGEFQKQKNLVVMAGSLEPRKNHLQFLSAIELLEKDGLRVKARILGSAGWQNKHILEKIHSLQRRGIDIERIGNISDTEMRRLIAESQVLLQISEAEGFGLPIAEALALGTKVVVSNIRPLNEWKSARVSIVDLGDIQQLKNEISEALNNPESEGHLSTPEITWNDWQQLLFSKNSAF
jgi:glycosyltransferase involved in cell wall biosynthesis